MMATRKGKTEVVSLLLEAGANTDLQNKVLHLHCTSIIGCLDHKSLDSFYMTFSTGWRHSCDNSHNTLPFASLEGAGQSWS